MTFCINVCIKSVMYGLIYTFLFLYRGVFAEATICHVGSILKTLRKINAIQIVSEDYLMQKSHTASSEPFYDTGYKSSALKEVILVDHDKRYLVTQTKCPEVHECALYDITIPVDENERCILSESIGLR